MTGGTSRALRAVPLVDASTAGGAGGEGFIAAGPGAIGVEEPTTFSALLAQEQNGPRNAQVRVLLSLDRGTTTRAALTVGAAVTPYSSGWPVAPS